MKNNFFLLAGPCVIEGEDMAMRIAEHLVKVTERLEIPLIFKGSYRKANRSRLDSFTGIGDLEALAVLDKVRRTFNVPVVTDIHESAEAEMAAPYVDILQIPAFLCRQTELLLAAARTGRTVNIKKGQFLAPESMQFAVDKVRSVRGCENMAHLPGLSEDVSKLLDHGVMVTDRGTAFGYGDLIVDFRGIPTMQETCKCPVVVDVTHSLQQPNQTSGVTGGKPEMIETIARAAIATGADGLFMETHPDPTQAKSDGANMLPLDKVEKLLERLSVLRCAVNEIRKI